MLLAASLYIRYWCDFFPGVRARRIVASARHLASCCGRNRVCGQRVCIHILSRCAILPTYTAIRVPFQRSSATYGYLLRVVTAVVLVQCILLRSVEWPIPNWSSFRYFRHCWPTRVVLSPCVGAYAIVIYLYSSCRPWASRIGAVCVFRHPADGHQIIIERCWYRYNIVLFLYYYYPKVGSDAASTLRLLHIGPYQINKIWTKKEWVPQIQLYIELQLVFYDQHDQTLWRNP
jgi:hypothetical protein